MYAFKICNVTVMKLYTLLMNGFMDYIHKRYKHLGGGGGGGEICYSQIQWYYR